MNGDFYLILAGLLFCGYALYRRGKIIKAFGQAKIVAAAITSSADTTNEVICIDCGDRTITVVGDATIITGRKLP